MLNSEIELVKTYLQSIGEFWADETSEAFYHFTIDFNFRNISITERFENELAGIIDYSRMYYEIFGINVVHNIYEKIDLPILARDKHDNLEIFQHGYVRRILDLSEREAFYNIEEALSFAGLIGKYTHVRLITLWDDCPRLSEIYTTEGLIDVSKPVRIDLLDFLESIDFVSWKKEIRNDLPTSFLILHHSNSQQLAIEVEMSSDTFAKLDGTDLWVFLNRNLTLVSYPSKFYRNFFLTPKMVNYPLVKVERLLESKSIKLFSR